MAKEKRLDTEGEGAGAPSKPSGGHGAPQGEGARERMGRTREAARERATHQREAVKERLSTSSAYEYDPQRNKAMRDDGDALPDEKTVRIGTREIAVSDLVKLAGLVGFFVLVFVAFMAFWPTIHGIFEEGGTDLLVERMHEAGPLGVLILFGLQLVQIIVAFIPGEVVQVVAGLLYGPLWGTVIILVGSIIASAVVFQLVHLLGAPFIRAMVSDSFLEKFRHFEMTGSLNIIVFILFLIPGLPKDAITYVVGVTDMRLSTFLLLSTLGRAPGVFVSAYASSSIAEGDYLTSAIMFAVLAVIAIVVIAFRDKILDAVSQRREP